MQLNFSRISLKICLYTNTHIPGYLPKYHWHFQESSRHSHSSEQTNISVWAHSVSSRRQQSCNILGMFFSLEKKESINNIKLARHLHLYLLFYSWHRNFQECCKMVLHSIQGLSSPNTIFVANRHFLNMHCNWIHKNKTSQREASRFMKCYSLTKISLCLWIVLCYSLFSGLISCYVNHPSCSTNIRNISWYTYVLSHQIHFVQVQNQKISGKLIYFDTAVI